MFKKLALTATLLATLNGCTAILWSQDDWLAGSRGMVEKKSHVVTKHIGDDQIRAFAMVKPDSKTLPANSLLMMGDQYWYAVKPEPSQQLVGILRAPLSQRFDIDVTDPNNLHTIRQSDAIYLDVDEDKNSARFSIWHLCLNYTVPANLSAAEQQKEQATLQKLSFEQKDNKWQRCFDNLKGDMYKKPENLPAEYQFQRSIPVKLFSSTTEVKTDVNGAMVLRNILLTPFTVLGDIFILPFMMIGK